MEKKQRKSLSSGGHAHREFYLCKDDYPRPSWSRDQAEGAGSHSPSGLRQKSVEAEPCSLWMVHRYTPQSTGDACTMARAAGPSSPALQRGDPPPEAITMAQPRPDCVLRVLRPHCQRLLWAQAPGALGSRAPQEQPGLHHTGQVCNPDSHWLWDSGQMT